MALLLVALYAKEVTAALENDSRLMGEKAANRMEELKETDFVEYYAGLKSCANVQQAIMLDRHMMHVILDRMEELEEVFAKTLRGMETTIHRIYTRYTYGLDIRTGDKVCQVYNTHLKHIRANYVADCDMIRLATAVIMSIINRDRRTFYLIQGFDIGGIEFAQLEKEMEGLEVDCGDVQEWMTTTYMARYSQYHKD